MRRSKKRQKRSRRRRRYKKRQLYINATSDGRFRVSGRMKTPKVKKEDASTILFTSGIALGIPLSMGLGYILASSLDKKSNKLKVEKLDTKSSSNKI